jgi:hypothetical protein
MGFSSFAMCLPALNVAAESGGTIVTWITPSGSNAPLQTAGGWLSQK